MTLELFETWLLEWFAEDDRRNAVLDLDQHGQPRVTLTYIAADGKHGGAFGTATTFDDALDRAASALPLDQANPSDRKAIEAGDVREPAAPGYQPIYVYVRQATDAEQRAALGECEWCRCVGHCDQCGAELRVQS